jgi:septal ring factor EnvC (AmiA/AmiB activator)
VTWAARLLLTALHPSDQRFSRVRADPATAGFSRQISSGTIATRLYTVSMRPPHGFHTVSTPSGFGRLLRHVGWPVSGVLVRQLGHNKRYCGRAAGEGGMS